MFNLKSFHNDESGITALETAIILIAFVVVAAVFAFTILSAGTASTERGQEAIFAGLEEVQSSMEIKGSILAMEDGTTAGQVGDVVFTVGNIAGGDAIDLNTTTPVVVIGYRDGAQFENNLTWTVDWIVQNDSDDLLNSGELAEITVDVSSLTTPLQENTEFTIEVKPPTGAVLNVQRTTPPVVEPVMDLN